MIDKEYGKYILICDVCGEDAGEIFEDFDKAVKYKKDEGWKSKKHGTEWEDICPECQKGE